MSKRFTYGKTGLLAFYPAAFFDLFFAPPSRENTEEPGATVVHVCGPLDHHAESWCDSYDAVLERVTAACEAAPENVILCLDSPGGMVSGCFDTARAIREKCQAAGKHLIAYVDGHACSAAYALAATADEIVVTETSIVGSIGVINTRMDYSKQAADAGVRVLFTTSGARKADGQPLNPLTDDEADAAQETVDQFAAIFFDWVAERRGTSAEKISALQAKVVAGGAAVAAGLADRVATWGQLLASFSDAGEDKNDMSAFAKALAALKEAAKGQGAEAKQALAALAALEGKKDSEPPFAADEKDEDEAKAEDESDKDDEDKKDEDKAEDDEKDEDEATVSAAAATKLAAKNEKLSARVARLEAENKAARMTALLASRKDVSKDLRATLKSMSIEDATKILAGIPQGKVVPAAGAVVPATQPSGTPGVSGLAPEASLQLKEAMGMASRVSRGVEYNAATNTLKLGAPVVTETKKGA